MKFENGFEHVRIASRMTTKGLVNSCSGVLASSILIVLSSRLWLGFGKKTVRPILLEFHRII